jgi:short-subunit dehydrogenase
VKVALITGASSGIGADAARHLAARGFRVVLVARGQAALQKVAQQIGDSAIVEACDASSGQQVLAMAERVRKACGIPDVIVNCAGGGAWKRIEDTSPDEAVLMAKAPYLAAFNMTHAFMRDMLKRGSGVVVHINSPASLMPWPSSVGYAAARWALRGLHESLRQDLSGTGVHSCHVVFGAVDSPYFEHNPRVKEKIPKIANTVRRLSTDECGRVIAEVAEHPKSQVVHPLLLRLYYWAYLIVPAFVLWLLRLTGYQRT